VPVLTSQQRKTLEDVCTRGRRASEQAVRAALTSLAVTAERPPAHLSEENRQLRRGLRAKSRQLGDKGDNLDLLVAECAYEQWHRLLFARFLAENNLLIHPDYHAPVTLDDCEDLAESLGEPDGWSVAARFAAAILPGIFRLDDPCVRLRLAPEGRLALESLLASLPVQVFVGDDALGWVYQFWQKDKKDEINASERKIGGSDLRPVTQLFTENYMVRFLLENSLGAWWAARYPDSPLVKGFDYLRLDDGGRPAAGAFDGWPERVAKVTVMDPCCGSGHFLVEAFSMLSQMRAEEEGLALVDAQDAVLRHNLFGLEIDPRCVQIAIFAVALQAWKAGSGWRKLPVPHIACSGIPVKAPVEEWKALAGDDERLANALVRLHVLFRDADTLGSLIDPRSTAELRRFGQPPSVADTDWDVVEEALTMATGGETADPATAVLGDDATGLSRAASLLSRSYQLVVTNPPFLGRAKQGDLLMRFCEHEYPMSRNDLGVVFLERVLALADRGGVAAVVSPQTWLQLQRYKDLRKWVITNSTMHLGIWLGSRAFEAISGEVVTASLFVIEASPPRPCHAMWTCDAQSARTPIQKASAIKASAMAHIPQCEQLKNTDMRILLASVASGSIGDIAETHQGIKTSDNPRFVRFIWELPCHKGGWRRMQSAPGTTTPHTGRSEVVFWEDGHGVMTTVCQIGAPFRGQAAWGRNGVVIAEMGGLNSTLYTGDLFDGTGIVVTPHNPKDLSALWAFCTSGELFAAVRSIDTSLKVAIGAVASVPFDAERWRKVAEESGPLPEPWSNDPTQWLFEGRPEASTAPLQVAVARLVGYRWPGQAKPDDLDALADADGIVCLPSVAGEAPAADRVQQALAVAFRDEWSPARVTELLKQAGSKKKSLADWLRDEFFKQHCTLFGSRPFVWHIWDGQRDGFAALVNYHCLDRKMLEKLTYTYLGDWIERQRAEVRDEKVGAEPRLVAASRLRSSLELVLEGEPPHDLYVRWKSLGQQPIGWNPDVNDGVRVNVRPFVEVGVLRSSFNIHWRKDRGKNPDGSERLNDLHFTTAEKRAARSGSA
jgi:hypothetical protein